MRILLHAGAWKTGSSAIQAFLKRNVQPLLNHGIIVPPMTRQPRGHARVLEMLLNDDPAVARPYLEELKALGADQIIDRDADLVEALGKNSIDVVVDLVAGPNWGSLLDILKKGGRYATAGAIAGPIVEFDVRTLYLKDLSFLGCTFQEEIVFSNLVRYIEAGEIKPVVSKTYPLQDIVQAQTDFLEKRHTGKLVLIPPTD